LAFDTKYVAKDVSVQADMKHTLGGFGMSKWIDHLTSSKCIQTIMTLQAFFRAFSLSSSNRGTFLIDMD